MSDILNQDVVLLLALYCLYFVWVVVPLLPAVVIYRLFPEAATDTQWKILGVVLKAGGASGFYFAILGLAFFKFLEPTADFIKSLHQPFWIVEAPIKFFDADNKDIIPTTSSPEQISVQPFAYDFKQTDEKSYLVTLRFSELNGETDSIRLIFPEGVGYIHLKELMTKDNTFPLQKKITLTKDPPIKIQPPLKGGQNQPAVAGLPQKLVRSLETNDLRTVAK
jgi:hypothetical protein